MNKPLYFGTNETLAETAVRIPITSATLWLLGSIQFILKARIINILKNIPIIRLRLFCIKKALIFSFIYD